MKIILDKKHTLHSDSMNMWITRKVTRQKRKGGTGEEDEVISGYHQDLNSLLNSLRNRGLRGIETTSLEALSKKSQENDELIIKFSKEISKKVMSIKE